MNITLISILSAIFLVSVILVLTLFRRPKRQSRGNRYSKKMPHVEPSLEPKPQQEFNFDGWEDDEEEEEKSFAPGRIKTVSAPKEARKIKNDLVVLYLMAPQQQPYNGYELLQALLSAGLRYGKMQIFHRHEQKTGRGEILFSLASATSPGTFDLPKMGGFSCPGLVLFFESQKVQDPQKAFEILVETAAQLAEDLGGDVLDEERQILDELKIAEIADRLGEEVEQALA